MLVIGTIALAWLAISGLIWACCVLAKKSDEALALLDFDRSETAREEPLPPVAIERTSPAT